MSEPVIASNEFQSTVEVGKIFGIKPETVRDWIDRGHLEGVRINGRWRVRRASVVALMNQKFGS